MANWNTNMLQPPHHSQQQQGDEEEEKFSRLPYKIAQFCELLSQERLSVCGMLLRTKSYLFEPSCEFGKCYKFFISLCKK